MAKSKGLSKKTIIISIIVLVAMVAAITMVTIFLKDKGQAEATDVDISGMQEQDRQNQGQTIVDSDSNDGSNPIINQEPTESNNDQDAQTQNNEQTTADGESTSSQTVQTGTTTTVGTQTGTGTSTTTQTDNVNTIGTTTIQRVETEEVDVPYQKTWEDNQLEWTPTVLASLTVASNRLNTELPELKVEKKAIIESGSTLVSAGEKITYKINVKNNSKSKVENIDITDIIPEHTTIDENSISNDGKVEGNKIIWNISIEAESEVEVSFEVKVNEEVSKLEKVTIKNTAVANGEESNEEANSVLETKKTSTVFRNGTELKDTDTEKVEVKKGDIIKYVISVQNKGEVEGTAKVIDDIAENLELTKNNKYTKQELKDGIEVTVAAGKTENVEIEVEVKDINGSIKNVATVGNSNPTDERETVNIKGIKEVDKQTVKEQEELKYTIKLHNYGSKDGEAIVKDSAPTGTTFIKESVKVGDVEHKEYTEAMLKEGISVLVKAGQDETVSFKVKVNTIEGAATTATIKNTALVDENKTTETTTEVEKEYVTVTVNKKWEDNEIQAQRRPDSIKFEVYKNSEKDVVADYVMNVKDGEHTYTFNNLPKYNEDGTRVNYTVQETEVTQGDLKFYKEDSIASTDGLGNKIYNVTNKFTRPTDTTTITVEKVWDDNNNLAGKRPTSVDLQLNVNENIHLEENDAKTDGNKWSKQITKPVYDENGQEIVYSATESTVPNFYTKQETGGSTTVINKFTAPTSEKTTITAKKEWDDNGNAAGKRPKEIKVTLKATNEGTIADKELTLKGDMTAAEWTLEEEVQKYNSKADEIIYVIEENATGSIFYTEVEGTADLTVTNKFEVPDDKADITVKKVWNDNKTTRQKVTFVVTGSNSATNKEEVTLTSADAKTDGNIWEKVVTTLPKYDEKGDVITYTVDEEKVPDGYIKSISEDNRTITNSLPGIIVEKSVVEVNGEDVKVPNIGLKLGDVIKYEIKVTNNGTVPLTNVTVTDEVINKVDDVTAPKKQIYLNYDETTGELTGKTNTVATGETILAGETKTYSVYYKVEADDVTVAAQALKNNAKATGTYKDSNGKDNKVEDEDDATVTIKDASGLTLVKDKEIWRNGVKQAEGTKVIPGDIIKYTITVTNTGNTVLNNVVVTDTMLGRQGYSITGGEARLNIGTLERAPKNVVIIHSQYVVQESDMAETEQPITNTATATSTEVNSEPDSETVTTKAYKENITVKKESKLIKKSGNMIKDKAEYGDTIKYTITATNTGNKAGTIDVTDKVPEGTELKEKNNDTNLNATELNDLTSRTGLTKTLNVPANNGTASIYFEVTVTAKPGETVKNIASASDGTKPEDGGHDVEKSVKVIKNTENTTITNSNVVIVIDKSGSMKDKKVRYKGQRKTRLEVAKIVVKDFIDTINLPEDGKNGSAVSIVTFNGPDNYDEYDVGTKYTSVLTANGKTISTTANDATKLKNAVDGITASNGTVIAGSLTRAKEQIEEMKKLYPSNNNIVIFVGDGDPDGDEADSYRIPEKAEELKDTGATVYAIGFGQNVDILKNTVASSTDKYYITSDNIDLSDVFSQIGKEITPTEQEPVTSKVGEIELTNLDTSKNIVLRVKTSTSTKFTTTEKTVDYYTNLGQIVVKDGKYYLNLKAFNANDEVEIDYFVK